MKIIAAVVLGLGLMGCPIFAGWAQEKKEDKKEDKKDEKKEDKKETKKVEAPKLEGEYKLVSGKLNNMAVGEEAKKFEYTFTSEKMTLKNPEYKFVMGYKLDLKTTPINIDMEILEGPEGTKGSKAAGIIEVSGEVVKLAYSMEKDKRPKNFEGKEGNLFELKKK